MPSSKEQQSAYKECKILLAKSEIKRGQIRSINRAAQVYNVPDKTLCRSMAGTPARRDCVANSKNVTEQEEDNLRKHLLELCSRGFDPNLKV